MKFRWLMAGLIAGVLAANPLFAQLGPKDSPSGSATDLNRVKVGQPAPDFALENVEGTPINLSEFRGKKAVVLVFYRGYW